MEYPGRVRRSTDADLAALRVTGASLRSMRRKRRLTQTGLAVVSGVNEKTIVNIEAARHIPRAETLRKLAAGLRCAVSDIAPTRG